MSNAAANDCVWIAGATGVVGRAALEHLLVDAGVGHVVAVGRSRPAVDLEKVRWLPSDDFRGLAPVMHARRPVAVLCAIGSTRAKARTAAAFRAIDVELPWRLAEVAREAGVPVFSYVSAVGANPRARLFYSRLKGEAEAVLKAVGVPTVHLLRPGLLLCRRTEFRAGERMGILSRPLWAWMCRGRWDRFRPIAAEDVGRALARTVRQTAPGCHLYEGAALRTLAGK